MDAGLVDDLPAALAAVQASLAPVNHNRLTDRLTVLGMMMAPNRPPAEAAVWLREMTRLLSDLPEDILGETIDGLVKTCKFLPACAEIREIADRAMNERRRYAGQIEAMIRFAASGQPIPVPFKYDPFPEPEPVVPCTAEQARAIMEEFGLRRNPLDAAERT